MTDPVPVSLEKAVELGAIDTTFFGHYFFPKAYRQESPPWEAEFWALLENPSNRYVAVKMARDFAKTTRLRVFTAKRIAYGTSRTIVYVSKSQDHAKKSIDWLRRAIEFNGTFANTFQLSKGAQWSGEEIDIYNGALDCHIRIIAIGITGSTRGINVDDYRPDLIIVDDPCDEENTATPEQRNKITELFFGSLYNSLAPESDQPEAKMALLQTPLDGEDLIETCMKSEDWATMAVSCFTPEMESSWPARYPTKVLLAEKQKAINRNMLSVWLREKEVTITSRETSVWKEEWLRYWEIRPETGLYYMGIDPTPPPKEGENKSSSAKISKLDDAVIYIIQIVGKDIYSVEYYDCKSPNPAEFISKIFEMYLRYKPFKVGCETVLFQRVLAFYIKEEMARRRLWFTIHPIEDKRRKETRIIQAISDRASHRHIIVHKTHTKFIEQYLKYPVVPHEDHLDAFSIALSLVTPYMEELSEDYLEGEYTVDDEGPALANWRSAP